MFSTDNGRTKFKSNPTSSSPYPYPVHQFVQQEGQVPQQRDTDIFCNHLPRQNYQIREKNDTEHTF